MQNSDNFIDSFGKFLKSNNIKYEDLIEKFFNLKNNSLSKEDSIKHDYGERTKDLGNENKYDYDLLVKKLDDIKKSMDQLSALIPKNN